MSFDLAVPQEQHNYYYYQEYCRLFCANKFLTSKLDSTLSERDQLKQKLEIIEENKRENESQLGITFDIAEEKKIVSIELLNANEVET